MTQFFVLDICTKLLTAYLPLDKHTNYAKEILQVISAKFCIKQQIKQVVGHLNKVMAVVQGGRSFIRRLINSTIGVKRSYQKVYVADGMQEYLKVWLNFFTNHSGHVFFLPDKGLSSETLHMYSDASPIVGAFIYGSQRLRIEYPLDWQEDNIVFLELFPISGFGHLCAFAG